MDVSTYSALVYNTWNMGKHIFYIHVGENYSLKYFADISPI